MDRVVYVIVLASAATLMGLGVWATLSDAQAKALTPAAYNMDDMRQHHAQTHGDDIEEHHRSIHGESFDEHYERMQNTGCHNSGSGET